MEQLSNYECIYTKELDCSVIKHLQKKGKAGKVRRTCLLVSATSISYENVKLYSEYHTKFMDTYLKQEHDKARLFFVYDTRGATYRDFSQIFKPFIDVHNLYREEYKSVLVATVIIIDNKLIQQLITMLFSTIYKPARPVHFLQDDIALISTL